MYVAEVELLLTEELRAFTAADIHIGRISMHGLQTDHIGIDDGGQNVFLMKVFYDITFDDDTPAPLIATVRLQFHTPGIRVRDAWPRSVTTTCPPERLAVTERLEFIHHTRDAGRLLEENVQIPELFPTVEALGIGGTEIRWRHTSGVRPGTCHGWLVVTAPESCAEADVRVAVDYELASTLGKHPRAKDDSLVVRLPHRPHGVVGLRYRLGFTIDMVDYSSRTSETQRVAQERLYTMLRRFSGEMGIAFDPASYQHTGDGFNFFLPDMDALVAVRHLVRTMPRLLREDNRGHGDKIRLRMAVDVGPVEPSALGFAGPTVIRFCRLAASTPIRDVLDETDTDIAIFISDTLYEDIVRQYSDLSRLPFTRRDVVVKSYQATAYLLSHIP